MPLIPGARLGQYEIKSAIGAGGMGEVYCARDTRLNRDVAVKVLPELLAADPGLLGRFEREAQLLASLNHQNIAQIYGFEDSPPTGTAQSPVRALVMELVDGPTLAERIARGAIPLEEALPIARQIAEALEAAHERGIVHRDLKPANIKISTGGVVKVLDFGLAKALQPLEGHDLGVDSLTSPTFASPPTRVAAYGIAGSRERDDGRCASILSERRDRIDAGGAQSGNRHCQQACRGDDQHACAVRHGIEDLYDASDLRVHGRQDNRHRRREAAASPPRRMIRVCGRATRWRSTSTTNQGTNSLSLMSFDSSRRALAGSDSSSVDTPRGVSSLLLRTVYCTSSEYVTVRPLRIYLLILVLGAMLPGTLLTGVLVWRAFANDRAASERRLIESARVDAAALDREFAGTISILEALATSPTLDRPDLEAFHAEGRRIQATQPGWYSVMLFSLDGGPLVSTRLPWGTPLLPMSEPDSLRRLVQTGQPVIGMVRRPLRGGPEHLFAIRVPVLRGGELKYALSAIVNVESLARIVPKQLPDSDEWTRTILDPEGTITVRTRGAENFIGAPASATFRERLRRAPETITRETTREGVSVYAATSGSAYGWTTVIVVPRATLDGALMASTSGILTGGALLMMCGLAAVRFVSRRLAADLAAATTAADAVAEGRSVAQTDGHVSETRRLQRSLASAASLLDRRARERDEQIRRTEAARAEAEQANQTKDQFLAVLGHELRNPLAPVLTALELMRARDPNVFTRERAILERQVAHMTRLVNDLLDVSRLARGKIELLRRRFELREAVDRALDMVQPLIAQKRHTMHVSVPASGLVIDGDIDRIVQVLSNLLTNAAKYTPPGGRITLTASAANDHVRIECEDNGPGVPPELVAKLFDRFAQGPRTLDRRDGGLGLGLALARSFTELHDGAVSLESVESGTGSRFVVTLPTVANADDPASIQSGDAVDKGIGRRVLLVEDNEDAREMLHVALGDAGHVVATAATASEAIALTTEFQPDVGVLDIGLPGMNGYELARLLRKSNAAIRLIALTGYGQITDADAARNAGFDAHCPKPVTTAALLGLIEDRTAPQA